MNVKVAIVIPTLNEEKFICGVIESVISQSYPFHDIDLMIVDGGSTDKTCSIVNDFSERYSNIRLINNPKRIQSAAFNIAIVNSSAPIIIRMDAHALYDVDYVKRCVQRLDSVSNVGNVGGCCRVLPGADTIVGNANAILNQVRFGIGGASFRVGAKEGDVDTVPFGAFLRTVVNNVGNMREDLPRGEDNEYNARIRKAGYRIFFDPAIICTYYARATLKASCRQMYQNGLSIGNLLHIAPDAVELRHIVPGVFVATLSLSLVLFIFFQLFCSVFAIVLGAYLVTDLIASLSACSKFGFRYIIILPILFFCIHISYGWGTIVGFLKNKQ